LRWALAPIAFVIAAGGPAGAETSQKLAGRIQIGVVHDSNVLEQLSNEVDDQALQLYGSVEHQLQYGRWSLRSVGRLGLHRYREIDDDSRVLGEGSWRLSYDSPGGFAAGGDLQLEGRDYADSASTRGYGLLRAEGFVAVPLGVARAQFSGGRTVVDYQVTPGHEQSGHRFDVVVSRRIEFLTVRAQVGRGAFDSNRRAVRLVGGLPVVESFNQEDEFTSVGLAAEYLRRFYVALEYTYLDNGSNSYGLAYHYHRVGFSFRRRLFSPKVSGGLLLQLEQRVYRDDIGAFDVINFDSERESNNAVIGEVGRDLAPGMSAKLRLGWHRDEAVVRGEYQTKVLGEVHLEWRF
jgi:hypothetical protein